MEITVLRLYQILLKFQLLHTLAKTHTHTHIYIMIHRFPRCWQAVVWLDRDEFKSTWLGNKSIYRTRMAIADGGELIVMAPGVDKFGEDPVIDALVRKVHAHVKRDTSICVRA